MRVNCPSRLAHVAAAIGLAVVVAPVAVAAQEGTITYTHVVKREMSAFGGGRGGPPGFGGGQQFTPPPRTGTIVLHFGPAGSLMRQETPTRAQGSGQRFRGGGGGFDRARAGRFGFGGGAATMDPYAATELQAAHIDQETGTMVEARDVPRPHLPGDPGTARASVAA